MSTLNSDQGTFGIQLQQQVDQRWEKELLNDLLQGRSEKNIGIKRWEIGTDPKASLIKPRFDMSARRPQVQEHVSNHPAIAERPVIPNSNPLVTQSNAGLKGEDTLASQNPVANAEAHHENPTSFILDPSATISGYKQQALADLWAKKTWSTPPDISPSVEDDSTDPRGRRGSIERYQAFQEGLPADVSFIGGKLVDWRDGTVPPAEVYRTIVGQSNTVYFTPFANQLADNTTEDFKPDAAHPTKFIGGYALTTQHLADVEEQDLYPRFLDLTTWGISIIEAFTKPFPSLLDFTRAVADLMDLIGGQFVNIDEANATPSNINEYRQETADVSYKELPRSTGGYYSQNIYVADPDLGTNLEDSDPANDTFPILSEINPSGKDAVVPFVQAGYYFAFQLGSGAHTVNFGDAGFGQDITYNILNPVYGASGKDTLSGTRDNDYLDGGNGKDELFGLNGDDLLVGGNGMDIIDGGEGSDELWGDAGRDIFIFRQGYGADAIYDFTVGDKIDIGGLSTKSIDKVSLSSGVSSLKLDFNNGDTLTLVGIEEESSLSISNGFITTLQNSSLV